MALEVGRTVYVEYQGDKGVAHGRLLLRTATEKSLEATTGETCSGIARKNIWWILTPDGDIYPEPIHNSFMATVAVASDSGTMPKTRGKKWDQVYKFGEGSIEAVTSLVFG